MIADHKIYYSCYQPVVDYFNLKVFGKQSKKWYEFYVKMAILTVNCSEFSELCHDYSQIQLTILHDFIIQQPIRTE